MISLPFPARTTSNRPHPPLTPLTLSHPLCAVVEDSLGLIVTRQLVREFADTLKDAAAEKTEEGTNDEMAGFGAVSTDQVRSTSPGRLVTLVLLLQYPLTRSNLSTVSHSPAPTASFHRTLSLSPHSIVPPIRCTTNPAQPLATLCYLRQGSRETLPESNRNGRMLGSW